MIEILLIYAIIPLIKIAVIVLFLSGAIAYLTLLERKLIAHIQVRLGPMRVGWHGLLQPIADGLKFLLKEDIVPAKADAFIFTIAPAISLLPAFLVFAVVPFGPPDMLKDFLSWILGWFPFLNLDPETIARIAENPIASGGYVTDINIAVLFVLSVSSVGILGIILGGWASNSKFPLLGALRSSAQMVSYEVALGFAIIGVLLVAGSLSLVEIVQNQQQEQIWYVFVQPVAFVLFFICGLAETNRLPFDLPEAETELVGGFHTEYSGFRFSLFFLAEYANMIAVSAIGVILFWGGWLRPFPNSDWLSFLDFIPGVLWFLGKVFMFLYVFIWLRGTLPRFRFDQLMQYGWKIFLPVALGNVVVTAGVLLAFL
ncbi:MAG: NADH-quinone oxidoreductase subunit NuoH [Acidobacteria bacterium]|nr:MAG: NADH-quinone oxidoreductase subunit NuoH [Acidobacteriota bacterium]TDI13425.1 MAG: NADH-quinone oxidoreductase subunit NuoH [Acidobacteriota bacterium]TDI18527.1 MAG: NADH-quinone oxidoreductase subunit NuoH [Acidobacteriota bacterium]